MGQNATCHVLVVDDDADLRETFTDVLSDNGCASTAVPNGRAALEWLRKGQQPCVILLDLMMPVMDGWTFRQEQSTDPALAKIPVVVMSAAANMKARPIDGVEFFAKPLDRERLLDAVHRYCD